ncbi:MAG: fatty acyl-AMP ligase [Panacagrimonas sp.]
MPTDDQMNALYPTLLHGLLAHAARQPEALLYRVIADDESVQTATWSEFLSATRRTASLLARNGVVPGTRVVLMLPNSMEFLLAFFAILWCGAIAVPASRPRRASNAERLSAGLASSAPELLICLRGDVSMLDELFTAHPGTAPRVLALAFAAVQKEVEASIPEPLPAPADIALIQFTSGSTNTPKGIVVSHGNLAINIEMMSRAHGTTHATKALSWLPTFHDAGLVCMAISPAIHGGSLTISSPQRFIRRPRSWVEDIGRYGITYTGAPNFAFDLAVRTAGDTAGLDLSGVVCLWNGSETVSADSLRKFSATFGPCGFRAIAINPAYGLAEATIGVTGGPFGAGPTICTFDSKELAAGKALRSEAKDAVTLVSAGAPTWRNEIRIVDAQTREPVADGTVGEIWNAGPHIAQGYWRRPEDTAATFGAYTASGEGPYLRSGDLGFLLDNRLYIAGRLKEIIIVRGRNLYPDEIELVCANAVAAVPLSQIVAVPLSSTGTEQVGVIVELPGATKGAGDAIARAFRTAVANAFEVTLAEVLFVDNAAIPRTTSGKKQRLLAARLQSASPEKLLHVSRSGFGAA